MSDWEKLDQLDIKDIHIGCLNCSSAGIEAPPEMTLFLWDGQTTILRDGKNVSDTFGPEGEPDNWDDNPVVADAESAAKADPDHDWRIVVTMALHGETYQRQGGGYWPCVESNKGYA